MNARAGDGSTALLWAAHWNDVAIADLLLRSQANANLANDFGMTPLSRACTNGSAALVELLLNAGANPNARIATGSSKGWLKPIETTLKLSWPSASRAALTATSRNCVAVGQIWKQPV